MQFFGFRSLAHEFLFEQEYSNARLRRTNIDRRIEGERIALAEQAEVKRQRAAVQKKGHKVRSIPVAKPKKVPAFLRNLVNKNK